MYKLSPAAYIFTHQYLNTMQQGIQSAHVIAEISLHSIRDLTGQFGLGYSQWAKFDKTIRILNAGSGEQFGSTYDGFIEMAREYSLPSAVFKEPDVNNMTTAFGFIMTPDAIERVENEVEELINVYDEDPDSHALLDFLRQLNSAR